MQAWPPPSCWYSSEAISPPRRHSHPKSEVTLLTAKGHVGEFTLPDGTKVWLNGESRLKYNAEFSGRTRDVALTGEAFFEVRKDTLRPFRVSMNDLQVEVLGTSFDAMTTRSDRARR